MKKENEEFLKTYTPVCGRMVVEMAREDTIDYVKQQYGMKEDSNLVLPEDVVRAKGKVPIKKGIVRKMAKDCYGERFIRKFGPEFDKPNIGDEIYFIPFEDFKLTNDCELGVIADEDLLGIKRA